MRSFSRGRLVPAIFLVLLATTLALLPSQPRERLFRGEPIEAWIARLEDLDPDVQNIAAFAVGRFGAEGMPGRAALVRMVVRNETTRRMSPIRSNGEAAAEALAAIGAGSDDVLDALATLAQHRSTLSRVNYQASLAALRALADLGSGRSVEALTKVAGRPFPEHSTPFQDLVPLQREAARALGEIGAPAEPALPTLEKLMNGSPDVMTSITARDAIGQIKRALVGKPRKDGGD